MSYEIDNLDTKILDCLKHDSRRPFLEIARDLKVSGGTIHARVNKMKEEGIIKGSRLIIDYSKLGYAVSAFVGIKLAKAGSFKTIQSQLESFKQITQVHYTTGSYSLFIKVTVPDMTCLHELLSEKLQSIEQIQSTETFVVLNTFVDRDMLL